MIVYRIVWYSINTRTLQTIVSGIPLILGIIILDMKVQDPTDRGFWNPALFGAVAVDPACRLPTLMWSMGSLWAEALGLVFRAVDS